MTNFSHQQHIIDRDPKKSGLFLGTGSGKTRIALHLAKGKTLVICPKTQKEDGNWERELEKIDIELDLTVISKETFRRDHKKIGGFQTVIIDEAETCLGVTPNTRQVNRVTIPKASQLFDAVKWYVDNYTPDRIYLCTATITRTPMTVWAAGIILGKNWNWYKWREMYYQLLPMPGRSVYAVKSGEEQKNKLAEAVNSIGYVGRLEDYFDVPDQTFKTDYVELTKQQQDAIRDIKLDYPDPIVAIGKRLQIENGVLKGDEYTDSAEFSNQKLERIYHYAEEYPRLIIWCKFTEQIKLYEKQLKKKGYTVHTLTGQTNDRESLFTTLENSDKAILIAQAQISAGWEWKSCPAMVFASRTYSIADYIQAQGRIQRSDRIKANTYIKLIAKKGIDEALEANLENKKDFSERIYYENQR